MHASARALAGVFVLVLLPGCFEEARRPDASGTSGSPTGEAETMTAAETTTNSTGACAGGGAPVGGGGQFCARRRVVVTGTLDVPALPVTLRSFNGGITVQAQSGARWELAATLEGRGDTEADARARLAEIDYSWSHADGRSHFVRAEARPRAESSGQRSAVLELKLPSASVLAVTATTSNGDVGVTGFATTGLVLTTSNGRVFAQANVAGATLTTSNGDVEARLTPVRSGTITATSSNGVLTLYLPEDGTRGYDLDATTSNGEVTVALRDGALTQDQPTHKHFRTNGYDSRDVRSSVRATTSNADVFVRPG